MQRAETGFNQLEQRGSEFAARGRSDNLDGNSDLKNIEPHACRHTNTRYKCLRTCSSLQIRPLIVTCRDQTLVVAQSPVIMCWKEKEKKKKRKKVHEDESSHNAPFYRGPERECGIVEVVSMLAKWVNQRRWTGGAPHPHPPPSTGYNTALAQSRA